MKPCGHLKTVWCACRKFAPKTVTYEVTKIAGIPIPPVRFKAPPNATLTELEDAAIEALERMP